MSEIWIPMLSAFVGALFGGAVSFVLQRQRFKHEQGFLDEKWRLQERDAEYVAKKTGGVSK